MSKHQSAGGEPAAATDDELKGNESFWTHIDVGGDVEEQKLPSNHYGHTESGKHEATKKKTPPLSTLEMEQMQVPKATETPKTVTGRRRPDSCEEIRPIAPRRSEPHIQPGAVAIAGIDGSRTYPSVAESTQDQEEETRRQPSLVANMVNDAELVVYADSVSPDERAKLIRIVSGVGILALLLVIGLTVGLTYASVGAGNNDSNLHPISQRCLLPVEEQNVFDHCLCSKTTKNLVWSETEQRAYYDGQALLLNRSVISDPYAVDSCSLENQCMVWTANYRRRNATDEGAALSFEIGSIAIQYYTMCMAYLRLDGDNWQNNDNWVQSDDICSWFGLSCSFLGLVTKVELQANNLNGTIPTEMRHIPFLNELDLSRNQNLKLPVGDFIGSPSFHSLDLSHSGLNGTINPRVERLEALDRLILSNNSLTGTVPINITRLSRLRELRLDHNSFSGTLHSEYAEVSFAHNDFTGTLPSQLARLNNLRSFKVNHNSLSGTIPSDFRGRNWRFLEEINLSSNNFTGPFPPFLGRISSLRSTIAHDTLLTGSIPESFCNFFNGDRVIILHCNGTQEEDSVVKSDCTCCNEMVFCIEKLPAISQALLRG